MSTYYRHLIESGLLLDIYPNAAVAYSLRKLRSTYTGSSIRVRRGDLTEQDFGFTSTGDLDTDAIINFFGNNLLLQSEDYASASWGKAQTVVVTDAITAPNGVDLADKLNETAVNNVHTLTQGFATSTLNNGYQYFISVYLKAAERNIIDLISGIEGSTKILRLNLTTGTVVSNGFVNSPTIIDAGSGWWKIELVVTSAVTSVPTGFQIRLTNGVTQSYLGVAGSGCYVWGAQVSGYESSVIPYFRTTTVAAANAFITTYYDQSGNGNNLTNTNAALQYRLVVNGHLYKNSDNGLPSALVTSTGFYVLSSVISTSNPLVNFNIYKSTSASMILFGNSTVGGRPRLNLHLGVAGSRNIETRLTNNLATDLSLPFETNGSFITSTTRDTLNYQEVSVNNSILGGSSIGVGIASITHFGRYNSSANASGGEIQEIIVWKQDYVSLKSNISDKINEYYGIY